MATYSRKQINFSPMPFLREREIWVHLPINYDVSSAHYPVIYMHDGQNLTDQNEHGSENRWKLEHYLEKNDSFIIVTIDSLPEHRLNEYAPFPAEEFAATVLSTFSSTIAPVRAEGSGYIEWIVKELKPYIDRYYRTKLHRAGIVGSSMGALISLYAQLKYPEIFTWCGSLSPAYWFSPTHLKRFIQHSSLTNKNIIFTTVGDQEEGLAESNDYLEAFEEMNQLLSIYSSARLYSSIIPKGKHNEKDWALLIEPMLQTFLFPS